MGPNLQHFEEMKHDLVLMGKAKTKYLLHGQELLQAGATCVIFEASAMRMCSKKVWEHEVRFMVIRKTLVIRVAQANAQQRAGGGWSRNSVQVRVSSPLWAVLEVSVVEGSGHKARSPITRATGCGHGGQRGVC